MKKQNQGKYYGRKIKEAKQLIKNYIKRPVGFPAIAEELNMSYHTLRKQFYRTEGMPMVDYYQIKRLETAKEMLKRSKLAIFQITYATGFSANSNFTRWFKQNTGITPTDYRKQFQR